jgi:hypothetical protein
MQLLLLDRTEVVELPLCHAVHHNVRTHSLPRVSLHKAITHTPVYLNLEEGNLGIGNTPLQFIVDLLHCCRHN